MREPLAEHGCDCIRVAIRHGLRDGVAERLGLAKHLRHGVDLKDAGGVGERDAVLELLELAIAVFVSERVRVIVEHAVAARLGFDCCDSDGALLNLKVNHELDVDYAPDNPLTVALSVHDNDPKHDGDYLSNWHDERVLLRVDVCVYFSDVEQDRVCVAFAARLAHSLVVKHPVTVWAAVAHD